jgi:Predicted nucleoside-diphosphate-sugar epimerases
MSERTATLIGATGLVGGELLSLLLDDNYFRKIRILVRRPFTMNHPKLERKIVDFSDADSLLVDLDESDVVFCTIGTTMKKVKGNKEIYRKIDYDIPVNVARYCKIMNCKNYIVVSAVGADSGSRNFYLKLKGEVEDILRKVGIESTYIMRPSMLLGKRNEFRFGERIVIPLIKKIAFLLPSRYKPIEARDVARAMLAAAKRHEKGFFICEYKKMKQLGREVKKKKHP